MIPNNQKSFFPLFKGIMNLPHPFLYSKKIQILNIGHFGKICFLSKPHHSTILVVSTPFEKYARQDGFIFPKFRDENTKNI